jgi:putative acetyltransferase
MRAVPERAPAAAQSLGVGLEIAIDDPRREDVQDLLAIHLGFSRTVTPPQYSFALGVDELVDGAVTFFTARRGRGLVGMAALKRLDQSHAELKSMHTREAERRQGVGRALVEYILAFARHEGYRQVSLETGATREFVAARALYAEFGFRPCAPFGGYEASAYNTFMTLQLDQRTGGRPRPGD